MTKKRNRTGPKRKAGPREPNGRRERNYVVREQEQSAVSVAIEARKRIFGMTEQQARQQDAATVIGRMHMEGRLSREQVDTATRVLEVRNAWQRAMGVARDFVEPRPETAGSGQQTPDEWAKARKDDYAAMKAVIEEACYQYRTRLPEKAIELFVFRDIEAPFMDGELRTTLNMLHRHFFIARRQKAA